MSQENMKTYRPQSEQLADIHVYVIPPELWRQNLRSATNDVIADSVSLGFLRVSPNVLLINLRDEILNQIGDELLPKDYVFLKSVGRCLTQVKGRQERELKAKHFIPPHAYAPEVFILDGTAELVRESPSTIYNQSLSATSLDGGIARHSQYYGDNNGDGGSSARRDGSGYPSAYHQNQSPPFSDPSSARRFQPNHSGNYQGKSFETASPTKMKSSYPAYNQPYSHDITAITNAHRNYPSTSQHNEYGDSTSTDENRPPYNSKSDQKESQRSTRRQPRTNDHSPDQDYTNDGRLSQDTVTLDDEVQEHTQNDKVYKMHQQSPKGHDPRGQSDGSSGYESGSKGEHAGSPRRLMHPEDSVQSPPGGREVMSATPPIGDQIDHSTPYRRGGGNHNQQARQLHDHKEEMGEGTHFDRRASHVVSPPVRKLPLGSDNQEALLQARNDLLGHLDDAKEQRRLSEKKREELVKKARNMQIRTNNRRAQARELWKKRYYEEKKKTPPLEAACQKVRADLDTLHKKYIGQLEGQKTSQREDHRIKAVKVEHEVDDLQRRADAVKMKLTAEMKLRNQAETELRALRAELSQKKMNMSLARTQQMAALGNSAARTPVPDIAHKATPVPITSRS